MTFYNIFQIYFQIERKIFPQAFAKYVLSLAGVGSAKYLFEWTWESFERILSGVLEVLEKQGQQCGVLIKYKKIIGIKYSPYIFNTL